MNSLNIDNRSKFSVFKKIKHLLYKYYHKFVKSYKSQSNSASNRFLVWFRSKHETSLEH